MFDQLPDIWRTVKLSDVLTLIRNGTSQTQTEKGVGLPVTRIETIADGFINPERVGWINSSLDKLNEYRLQDGDILFSHINSIEHIGKCAVYEGNPPVLLHGMNLLLLRSNKQLIDPNFLLQYLRFQPISRAIQARAGRAVNQASINQRALSSLEVILPPLPEQRRIVSIIREADELRRLSKKAENTAKSLYGATFEYLFGTGAVTPKHPDTIKLRELLKVPLTSGFSPTSDDTPPGIPVFTLAAITDFGLDETQVKYYPVKDYQGSGSDLEINDILITRSNTTELVGKVARYKGKPTPVIYPDLTIRIRLKNAEDSAYVENFLRSPHMVSVIRRLARGTSGSMKKISQNDIDNFDVLWVSEEERKNFSNQVNEIDEMIDRQKLFKSKIDKLFSSLLVQAFTGELTARWRGQHEAELIEAARERDALLSGHVVSGAARITGSTILTAEATVTRPAPPEREQMVATLSLKQQRVLDLANSMEGYFTLQQLSQSRHEASELSHADIHQGLDLLAALGLVLRVRVATEPIKNELFFTPAYRRFLPSKDDSRLRDLDRLGANGG